MKDLEIGGDRWELAGSAIEPDSLFGLSVFWAMSVYPELHRPQQVQRVTVRTQRVGSVERLVSGSFCSAVMK